MVVLRRGLLIGAAILFVVGFVTSELEPLSTRASFTSYSDKNANWGRGHVSWGYLDRALFDAGIGPIMNSVLVLDECHVT